MDEIKFLAGSEKKFLDFVKNIKKKDKVVLISHTDLDGITSAKVVDNAINVDIIKLVNYDDINEKLVLELKNKKVTKVIMTDLAIDEPKIVKNISKFADVLVIDHHLFNKDFNSDKITFVNIQGNCAAYICYLLFSKIKNIEEIDWLVACACIADWQYFNNQGFMDKVFNKHDDKFEIINNEIRKSGEFWDLQWNLSLALIYFKDNLMKVYNAIGNKFGEVGNLREHAKVVNDNINESLRKFEDEKEVFGDIYFWELKNSKFGVKSIVSTFAGLKHRDHFVLISKKEGNKYVISARRQDKKKSVVELLKKATSGLKVSNLGGHIPAGGAIILAKDLDKFKKKLQEIAKNS